MVELDLGRRRLVAAFATSATAHAVALALVLSLSVAPLTSGPTSPIAVFPIALVGRPGEGAGGGSGDAPAAAPEPPPAAPPATVPPPEAMPAPPTPAPIARPKPGAKPKPVPSRAEPPTVANVPRGGGTDTSVGPSSATGSGGGAGGGSGGSAASPAYGVNPEPPYPLAARRLGLEGTVLLRVRVASDGSPREVTVLRSSGHDVLDESAATTVRTRWRFVPARRDGIPVEDSVQVPIRFRRTAG